MQLDEAIKSRKSVKNFSDKKPDWRDIIEAIDAARYASMAGNIYSLRFIVVDDKEKIQKLSECCQQDFVGDVNFIVVACSDGEKTQNAFGERAEKYLRQQAGAAIQNFLLKIEEARLKTCWVGHFVDDMIKHELSIPKNIDVEALFPIGYETKEKGAKRIPRKKTDLDGILFFNKWGKKKMNKPSIVKNNA